VAEVLILKLFEIVRSGFEACFMNNVEQKFVP